MNAPKYFVIRTEAGIESVHDCRVHDCLIDARAAAVVKAKAYPGTPFLIAVETQSVVVQTQVNWSDK